VERYHSPTAQTFPEFAAVAWKVLFDVPTFGVLTCCQVVPFHFSAKLRPFLSPTAQTLVADGAATPNR
jgi:hypothetical protein